MFFERPSWDKFPGAHRTFAADVLNPDGRVVQQPSTHLLSQAFARAFDVKFKDRDGKDKYGWITCYGPAISRIFASIVIVHGDDKGLRFPFEIAPLQIAVVQVTDDLKVAEKANNITGKIKKETGFSVELDFGTKSAGEKFNYWEMKGVPVRIDIGLKDIKDKSVTVFRRDTNEKKTIREENLLDYINKISEEFTRNLTKQADKLFDDRIKSAKDIKAVKKIIEDGGIARCGFCSIEKDGESCAEKIEKEIGAKVRGRKFDEIGRQKAFGKCVGCGKEAKHMVYIAREY
jgi:prolyl-tRNA synthetase